MRGGPPQQHKEPPDTEKKPTLPAKKQPLPTAIQQAAAGELLSPKRVHQRKPAQKKSGFTPTKKVRIATPELLHSDVVKSLTSQGRPKPKPHKKDSSSYISEPCLNILDHHCDICQNEGSLLDQKLPRWCEHLEKEERGESFGEYGDYDEDADSASPAEHLRYACEIYFGNTKQLAIIDSGAWSPWMSNKLYIKYGPGSLQPCNEANGAYGRSLDVIYFGRKT